MTLFAFACAASRLVRLRALAFGPVACSLSLIACGSSQVARPRTVALASPPDVYRIEPTPDPVRGDGDRAALAAAIARASENAALRLEGDGRLAELAERFRAGPADSARLSAAARELGLVDGELALRAVRADSPELLPAALATELAAALPALAPTHFGVFAEPGGRRAIALLGRRPPALAPVPRRTQSGSVLRVQGRLAATEREPMLAVDGPGKSLSLPAGAGPSFELNLPTWGDGVYRMQLRSTWDSRSRTVAEWLVYVGEATQTPRATLLAAEQVKRELYQRLRELRVQSGLEPLAIAPELEQRAHAPDAEHAGGDDRSAPASSGEASARAEAQGADAPALFMALVSQPALRAALLGAEATHVGVAVAGSGAGFAATVLVTRLAPALLDPELAPARILSAINENRRARGAESLRPDADLARVARGAAAELAAHPELGERAVVERANAELARFALAYRRVAAVAASVHDPLEAAALEPALEPDARAIGIALSPNASRDSAAVVIALGWER